MIILNKHHKSTDNAIYIGRGSVLGNPFVIGVHGSRTEVIAMYDNYIHDQILLGNSSIVEYIKTLESNSRLLCYCCPNQCHGKVIEKYWKKLNNNTFNGKVLIPSNEGVDHINISSKANSELGTLLSGHLNKIISNKSTKNHKDYFKNLYTNLFRSISKDTITSDLLCNNILPLELYGDSYIKESRWFTYTLYSIKMKLTNSLNVAVVGCRTIADIDLISQSINEAPFNVGRILSGGAKGADTLGEKYALEHNLPIIYFYPYWEELGKRAGMQRNSEMIKFADGVIAVWDGISVGTRNAIETTKANRIPLYLKMV